MPIRSKTSIDAAAGGVASIEVHQRAGEEHAGQRDARQRPGAAREIAAHLAVGQIPADHAIGDGDEHIGDERDRGEVDAVLQARRAPQGRPTCRHLERDVRAGLGESPGRQTSPPRRRSRRPATPPDPARPRPRARPGRPTSSRGAATTNVRPGRQPDHGGGEHRPGHALALQHVPAVHQMMRTAACSHHREADAEA